VRPTTCPSPHRLVCTLMAGGGTFTPPLPPVSALPPPSTHYRIAPPALATFAGYFLAPTFSVGWHYIHAGRTVVCFPFTCIYRHTSAPTTLLLYSLVTFGEPFPRRHPRFNVHTAWLRIADGACVLIPVPGSTFTHSPSYLVHIWTVPPFYCLPHL